MAHHLSQRCSELPSVRALGVPRRDADGIVSESRITASPKIENGAWDGRNGQSLVLDEILVIKDRAIDRAPRRTVEPCMRRERELDLREA